MAKKPKNKEFEYAYKAVVLKAFDGDTFTAQVDLGFGMTTTMQFNLLDADTHEVRGETLEKGRAARDKVRELMVGKDVILRTSHTKVKGRYGAHVEIDGEDLAEKLTKKGHTKPGKGKPGVDEEESE